jgi:hypothetical protein
MTRIVSVIALMLSLSVFAQDKVLLNAEKVSVNAAEAILVRTASTPNKVKVSFQVPMYDSVCQTYATRMVIRTSGALCGYTLEARTITYRTCEFRQVRTNICTHYRTNTRLETVQVPRTCQVSEQYCSSYGTAISHETGTVTIKFKKLPALGGTEQDTFLVKGKQKHVDGTSVVFEVTPQATLGEYTVKDRGFSLFNFSKFVIKPKSK